MGRAKRIIPGFGLTMGITMSRVGFFAPMPMIALAWRTADLSLKEIIDSATDARVLSS
jgi:sulfate transport system permease protein